MRSKTPLMLLEQLVMVLVFALAAAVCLRLFAFSGNIARKTDAVTQAALLLQNTAEQIKQSDTGLAAVTGELEWKEADHCWYGYYDRDWNQTAGGKEEYQLIIRETEAAVEGLGSAELQAVQETAAGREILFQLTVGWQEVSSHG